MVPESPGGGWSDRRYCRRQRRQQQRQSQCAERRRQRDGVDAWLLHRARRERVGRSRQQSPGDAGRPSQLRSRRLRRRGCTARSPQSRAARPATRPPGDNGADLVADGSGSDTVASGPDIVAPGDEVPVSGGGTFVAGLAVGLVEPGAAHARDPSGGIGHPEPAAVTEHPASSSSDDPGDQSLLPGDESSTAAASADTALSVDLGVIDPSYDAAAHVWTLDFEGSTGPQHVELTEAEVTSRATWDPAQDFRTLFDDAGFTDLNFVDAGGDANATLQGPDGSNLLFGGHTLYATPGDDLLVGGDGYDVYHVGRGQGDNLIIDGYGPAGGFANDLVLYLGFDGNGGYVPGTLTEDANNPDGVTFANNHDGTWTIAFNGDGGSVTFAAQEISDIELHSYADAAGDLAGAVFYAYDAANDAYTLFP